MKLPGILYSLILAIGAWATGYFATGQPGGEMLIAPILLAAIPIVGKFITVQATPPPPAAQARGMGGTPEPQPTKTRRLLLG